MDEISIEQFFTDDEPVVVSKETEKSICEVMEEFERKRSIEEFEAMANAKEIILI